MRRREALAALGAAALPALAGCTIPNVLGEDEGPTLSFPDQRTDGETVLVERLEADGVTELVLLDQADDRVYGSYEVPTEESEIVDREIELDRRIEEPLTLTAVLYRADGPKLAEDSGHVVPERSEPEPEESAPALTFRDQTSDGSSVVIDRIETDVDSSLFLRDDGGDTIGGEGVRFNPGQSATDITVSLDRPLEETQTVTATLYESNGGPIAQDRATVTVE